MYKLRQTWTEIFANKMLYALDVRISQIDPAWPITAKPQDTVSIHINPKFLSQKSPSPDLAAEEKRRKEQEDEERRKREEKEEVLRQARERQRLLEEERAQQAEESQVRDQLLAKQQELIKLQQERLELELSEARARLEQQTKQLQMREQVMRQQLLAQLQQNARTEPVTKQPSVNDVKPAAPVSNRDPRTKRDPPTTQHQQLSKPPSNKSGDSKIKPAAESRSSVEKDSSAFTKLEKSSSVKEPSSPTKKSTSRRSTEKTASGTKGVQAQDVDSQKTQGRSTHEKSKVQTNEIKSVKKEETNDESEKLSKDHNDRGRHSTKRISRERDGEDVKQSNSRRSTHSQDKNDKKDTTEKGTRSSKAKRDSSERDRIPKLDRSKRNYRTHRKSESPEADPQKDRKRTRGRGRSPTRSRSRSPLARSSRSSKAGDRNNRRSPSAEHRQRENSETRSHDRHKHEDDGDRRASAGRKGRRSITPQKDRASSPPKKKVKQEEDDGAEDKGGLSEDLADLFGTEDRDYRRLPPIPKLSTNLPLPEEASVPGGLMSPSVGWSKFKASHPDEFPFRQPRTNDVIHRQTSITSFRSPLKSPPTSRYLDQPFGSGDILQQAEQQLMTGKLTPSQHQELVKQLQEYQELQQMKQDLREENQRLNQAGSGNTGSVVQGPPNTNQNDPYDVPKSEPMLGIDGPSIRQTLLPDPGRQALLPDPARQALLPDPVRKTLLPDPGNEDSKPAANMDFRCNPDNGEQPPTSGPNILNRNISTSSAPRFPMDPRLRQERQPDSGPREPHSFDKRMEFNRDQSFPYETSFSEDTHVPSEPVHEVYERPAGQGLLPEPGPLRPPHPAPPQEPPIGPNPGPLGLPIRPNPGPQGPPLRPQQGAHLGPMHRPPMDHQHDFVGPRPGGPPDMIAGLQPGPPHSGPVPGHQQPFPGPHGPLHRGPGPQLRMPLEPNINEPNGDPARMLVPGPVCHDGQGPHPDGMGTMEPWYDTNIFYCPEHDPRWASRVKTKPQNDRTMWVVFGMVRIAVPHKSMARDVQLGRHNEFRVHMKYERWERCLYLDGKMFYRVGDDPKKLILTKGSYKEEFFVYMEGTVVDVWIDDAQYQLHRDAPPAVIHFSNRDHKFQINTESNQVVVDGHDVCPAFGSLRQIQLAYVVHSIQFEPPARRILIDGNMCDVDLVSRFPVVIVAGKARGVGFQGPPRKIIINKFVYEVPMDRPVRARIFGHRPQLLAFGGPGHEVIIDDKWFEVKFGDASKQIRVGSRHCRIELPGPPPEVKVLGEYVPVEQIITRTSRLGVPPMGHGEPGPQMAGHPHMMGLPPMNPGMQGPPRFGPPGPHSQGFSGPPKPAPALDVNSLLSKLKSAGIIGSNPGSNQATPPPSETDGDEIEQEMVSRESVEDIPDLTAFKADFLKKRYDGARQLLSVGIQCASCGLRFVPEHKAQYKEHLDWHFRQNKRGKDDMKVAKHRHWYYSLSDWIQYEEISDLQQRAQSSFFEQSLQASQQPGGRSLPGQGDFISCPAVSGEEDDGVCGICGEAFEQFWDEDEEEWHLKDAIRAKNGKTYHPVCYEDVNESNTSLLETPSSADLVNNKPQFSPLPAPVELQPVATTATTEPEAKNSVVTVTSTSAAASPARDVDEYVPPQLMEMINNPLGYLTSLSKHMKKTASSSALSGTGAGSPAATVTATSTASSPVPPAISTVVTSVTPKEYIPTARVSPVVSSPIPPAAEPPVVTAKVGASVNMPSVGHSPLHEVQHTTQPLGQGPLLEKHPAQPLNQSPLANIQTLTYTSASHTSPASLLPSGGGTPVRDEPDFPSGGGTPVRDEPGFESGRGTPVEDEPQDPFSDQYGQNLADGSVLHVIAPLGESGQGTVMSVVKQEPNAS